MKSSNSTGNVKALITDNKALKAIVAELQAGTIELQKTVVWLQGTVIGLEGAVAGLEATLGEKNVDINLLTEQLNLYKALVHARKSEKRLAGKIDQRQMSLFDEAEATPPEDDDGEASTEQNSDDEVKTVVIPEHKRTKKGRRPLPADIPREDIICDIAEEDKVCPCGCQLKQFGEEVSEKLDIIPQTIRVIRTIRPKYACPHCEGTEDNGKTVKIAPVPLHIISKGLATASLLAYIIMAKFADALPLYRQSKIFERLGIYISRSTMSGWMILAADACKPLITIMLEHIRSGSIINMDETPVQVLREPGRANTTKSYMWLICGGRDGPIRLFHYAPSRAGEVAKKLIGDFKGFLQTDGYAGYTAIGKKDHIKHVGCLAHVRRKFIEVNKGNSKNKPGLAKSILDEIAKVYKWEKLIRSRTLTPDKILAIRSKKVKPLLAGMFKLMTEARDSIPPKTLLGTAVKYTLGQWEHIENYLLNPKLTPDNNFAENAIRPFVIGRKNWLFSGSPHGAESSAILYSLIETAKANKLNPQAYLLHVFEKMPLADTPEKLEALLPWNCNEDILNS